MFNRILCPIDGSEHAAKALDIAIDFARRYEADLLLGYVVTRHAVPDELMAFARIEGLALVVKPEVERLQGLAGHLQPADSDDDSTVSARVYVEIGQHVLSDARRQAAAAGLNRVDTILMDGDAGSEILRCVENRDVDCVVMGSRGLSDLKGLFLGSVSHKVVNRAACTCVAVK